nr:hypothetical protein B0A51_17086 [Rachicladosporium sp. CCFEE 5018]
MQSEQGQSSIATPLDPTIRLRRSCSTDELVIPSSTRNETIAPPAYAAATPGSEVRVTELSDQIAGARSAIEGLQTTEADSSRRVAALEAPAQIPRLALDISISATPAFDALRTDHEAVDDSKQETARVAGWAPAPDFWGRFNADSREVLGVVRRTWSADETGDARNTEQLIIAPDPVSQYHISEWDAGMHHARSFLLGPNFDVVEYRRRTLAAGGYERDAALAAGLDPGPVPDKGWWGFVMGGLVIENLPDQSTWGQRPGAAPGKGRTSEAMTRA